MSRLTELEVRYTFLERTVRDLDDVVLELRTEIQALRRQVCALEEAKNTDLPHNEKPPHY